MTERFANVETMVEFVKKYTPCINGETTMECVERSIRNAPTIEAKPVVHGHWISKNHHGYEWVFVCSNCDYIDGYPFNDRPNYCPNCGAKMDGGA